jgi:hypothetical protein
MKNLMVVVCVGIVVLGCVSGCGSAASASSVESVTMQGGQWEYVVTPENGGITMYFGTNLPMTNADFNASNVQIFQPSQISSTQNIAPIVCAGYSLNGAIGGTKIDGQIATPTGKFASFSGQLSSNGRAISDGKYSGQNCAVASTATIKGALTGYTVAPLNGTFTGRLTSSANGSSVMTVAFTQNSDFSVTIAGTFVENGVTTSFTNTQVPDSNLIEGASVFFGADTVNVNGKSQYSGMGHLNPTATQMDLYFAGPNDTIIGTLTKQ